MRRYGLMWPVASPRGKITTAVHARVAVERKIIPQAVQHTDHLPLVDIDDVLCAMLLTHEDGCSFLVPTP